MSKNKHPEIRVTVKASSLGNWWVTYRDGRLAFPRPLDSRAQAREIAKGLRAGEQNGDALSPEDRETLFAATKGPGKNETLSRAIEDMTLDTGETHV